MSPAKSPAAARDADPVGGAQSIFRVLRILKYVGAAPARGVGLTDVARDLGLTPPTAHRMLSALLQEGFLALNPKLKTYSLGRESYILGLAAESRHGIKAIAESAVLRLAQSTGDTSFLSVRSGHEAVCVDRKTGDFPIKILTLEVGHRRPLGVGAGSLALLAFLPNDDIERVLARYDASAAPDLPSTAMLREDIAAARKNGYALNPGRIIPDMLGVGVPVYDREQHVVAALSVAAIRSRLSGARLQEVVAALQPAATELGAQQKSRPAGHAARSRASWIRAIRQASDRSGAGRRAARPGVRAGACRPATPAIAPRRTCRRPPAGTRR
ncbi:IclR family transcriptional regulator [Achromobacter ruhlandii]|uniref:IclR family transcriptional regulator n=3 Tax=Achromobacter TaxID=222 RepID=UPI002DB5BD9C|nr:IclR family transcriptional regulator [Achromobacter ruhlandii]MEB6663485.1 IclR family transcriptional regulator [Achromobacter ruhlandii]